MCVAGGDNALQDEWVFNGMTIARLCCTPTVATLVCHALVSCHVRLSDRHVSVKNVWQLLSLCMIKIWWTKRQHMVMFFGSRRKVMGCLLYEMRFIAMLLEMIVVPQRLGELLNPIPMERSDTEVSSVFALVTVFLVFFTVMMSSAP